MSRPPKEALQSYADAPYGTLSLKGVRIGRISIEEMLVHGREAAITAQEILNEACSRTQRTRSGKHATRYPEPLPVAAPARLLCIEIEDHLRDMERRCLQKETVDATARTLRLLQLTCGDVPVSRIDHKHIYRLWDLMRWAPPGLTSSPDLLFRGYDAAIARGKEMDVQPPAPATAEKHRRFLVAFFNQLVRTRAIPASPMDAFGEIKKDLAIDPDKPERLFSDEDLPRIFEAGRFIPWAQDFPHRWWGPMIGLHTGMRVNEVAQLKVADVINERGLWCLAIRMTVDPDLAHKAIRRTRQSLKGAAAVRTFPIPQPLIQAGFLDYIADVKACGHPRLFPHLSAGVSRKTGETNARYSQAMLTQFSRYLKELGFPKGVGFHAFRHTLATELHHQGVPEEDIALITGHSISKKVPVLHAAYFHKKPAVARTRQAAALAKYRPPVQLPVYQRGQFAKAFSDPRKFYP